QRCCNRHNVGVRENLPTSAHQKLPTFRTGFGIALSSPSSSARQARRCRRMRRPAVSSTPEACLGWFVGLKNVIALMAVFECAGADDGSIAGWVEFAE